MTPVPASILRALSLPLDPSKSTLHTSGVGSGFASTGRIRASVRSSEGEEERQYFVKTSASGGGEMFRGEHASLNAIASIVPGFCPRGLAWGSLDDDDEGGGGYFLVTEYLDLSGRGGRGSSRGSSSSSRTLAQRLGKLHSTPAPAFPGGQRGFGFPVPTYCGDTRQANRFRASWAEFYADERLRTIVAECERRNGCRDDGLRELVERTATEVVPALLRDGHLGGGRAPITPVVVHGDLWSGNASRGRIVVNAAAAADAEEEGLGGEGDVVYDPSACYAHSEYDLGIMRMFGGFGRAFFDEYHRLVPRTEPVDEYEDRVQLYEL